MSVETALVTACTIPIILFLIYSVFAVQDAVRRSDTLKMVRELRSLGLTWTETFIVWMVIWMI